MVTYDTVITDTDGVSRDSPRPVRSVRALHAALVFALPVDVAGWCTQLVPRGSPVSACLIYGLVVCPVILRQRVRDSLTRLSSIGRKSSPRIANPEPAILL